MYCSVYAILSYLHEQLCVVEDRVEGALGEVAAGGSEVDLPDTEAGIQQLQTLLYILHHTHLQRGHPHVVHKYVCRAVLCVCVCGRGKYPAVFTYGTRKKFVSLQGSHPLSSCKVSNQQLPTTTGCHWLCHTVKLHTVCSVRYMTPESYTSPWKQPHPLT